MNKKRMRELLTTSTEPEQFAGNVYAARNPLLPGMVKIGMTRNGVQRRLTNLSCSLPVDFELICEVYVPNPSYVESTLHGIFRDDRVSKNREFFRVSEDKVLEAFSMINAYDFMALMTKVFEGCSES